MNYLNYALYFLYITGHWSDGTAHAPPAMVSVTFAYPIACN